MENLKVKISVVLATYNGEKYIAEQLNSIIEQSVPADEIIIVDDCSSDETVKIINQYTRNYSNIKLYVNDRNIGVIGVFNKAIGFSLGDFILFADQDDVWFKDKIKVLLSEVDGNWLIYSDSYITDEYLNITAASALQEFESGRKFLNGWSYLLGNNVTGCTMLISRSLIELGFPIPNFSVMFHDQYFAILSVYSGKLQRCEKVLQYYRQHANNQSVAFRQISYDTILENSNKMSKDLLLLLNNTYLSQYKQDILLAHDFFKAMAHKKYPSWKLLCRLFDSMTLRMFFWFIRMACLSKSFAQLNYNLAPLKTKIKKWIAK